MINTPIAFSSSSTRRWGFAPACFFTSPPIEAGFFIPSVAMRHLTQIKTAKASATMNKNLAKKAKHRSGTVASKKLKKPQGAFVFLEVVSGVEGHSLYICDANGGFRLVGPKPWGGGTTVHKFKVDYAELLEQANNYAEAIVRAKK